MSKAFERLKDYQTQMSIYAEQHKLVLASDVLDMIEQLQDDLKDDIEKVVAELDKLMVKTTSKMVESKDVPEWFYEVKTGEYINKKDAIDIVRKGGVE